VSTTSRVPGGRERDVSATSRVRSRRERDVSATSRVPGGRGGDNAERSPGFAGDVTLSPTSCATSAPERMGEYPSSRPMDAAGTPNGRRG